MRFIFLKNPSQKKEDDDQNKKKIICNWYGFGPLVTVFDAF